MEKTLFTEYVSKYFKGIVNQLVQSNKPEVTDYLFKKVLREEFTPTLSWNSAELTQSIPVADVVSTNSSLPLKQRESIKLASGDVPKLGIKYKLTENDINTINIMRSGSVSEQEIAKKIFSDTAKCIEAIDKRIEYMLHTALSTGVLLVEEGEDNSGIGVRASFGYKDENKLKASAQKWGVSGYTPITDLRKMFAKAESDGNTINHVYITKKYFDLLRASDEAKALALVYANAGVVNKGALPMPSKGHLLEALKDEFGAEFHIVSSKFNVQKPDGTYKSVSAWKEDAVVGLPNDKVGRLVYGQVAEETHAVSGVDYQKAGNYTLVSKYSNTDPLNEFTCGQALVLPVIDGANAIYVLSADEQ